MRCTTVLPLERRVELTQRRKTDVACNRIEREGRILQVLFGKAHTNLVYERNRRFAVVLFRESAKVHTGVPRKLGKGVHPAANVLWLTDFFHGELQIFRHGVVFEQGRGKRFGKELGENGMHGEFLPFARLRGQAQNLLRKRRIFAIVHLPVSGGKLECRKEVFEFFREYGKGKDVKLVALLFEKMHVLRRQKDKLLGLHTHACAVDILHRVPLQKEGDFKKIVAVRRRDLRTVFNELIKVPVRLQLGIILAFQNGNLHVHKLNIAYFYRLVKIKSDKTAYFCFTRALKKVEKAFTL